jgi:hypothetical protein
MLAQVGLGSYYYLIATNLTKLTSFSLKQGRTILSSATVNELRDKIKDRTNWESTEVLWKAKKKLVQAINKARKDLNTRGIQARKDKKARLQQVKDYTEKGKLIPIEDLVYIREPDKEPTVIKKLTITEEYYPELVLKIQQLESKVGGQIQVQVYSNSDSNDDIIVIVERLLKKEEVLDYLDSSPLLPNLVDSSDVESNTGSIDSIQRNADFVQF